MSILKSNGPAHLNPLFKLGLTNKEIRAVQNYKSSRAYLINDALRGNRFNSLPEDIQDEIKTISSGINKFPKHQGTVYRNVSFDDMISMYGNDSAIEFIEQHQKEKTVTYPSFTSSSKNKDGYPLLSEHQANIEINSKNGRDITYATGVKGEEEVLFDRNSSFKVIDSHWNDDYTRLKIKMKEL